MTRPPTRGGLSRCQEEASSGSWLSRLRSRLESQQLLYSITSYSEHCPVERLRLRHKQGLSQFLPALVGGEPTLLVLPEGHQVVPKLLERAAGAATELLAASPDAIRSVLIDDSLRASPDLVFTLEEGRQLLTVGQEDFAEAMPVRHAKFAVRDAPTQYRGKVRRVAPESARGRLREIRRCFLGVSLENENFECDQRLRGTLRWIGRHFNECLVLVGDWVHRHTLQIRNPNLDPGAAEEAAIRLGERFMSEKRAVFDEFSRTCQFEYLTMAEVARGASFEQYHAQMTELASQSADYSRALRSFADEFVGRRPGDDTSQVRSAENVERSMAYLLEEGAIFACLERRGWPVMVYPGSIDPFIAIADGEFPEAPQELQRLISVSLKFRRLRQAVAKGRTKRATNSARSQS